jgi:S-methylmethionine-dependent homocysteine/selenocysteine methylase
MNRKEGLLDRLEAGPVICAEGYLFEFERRGYLQAGAYVPEVVLEHPELVAQLHREFVHAGSDVVEAFTYYAHREKLRLIGKEEVLEPMNRYLGVCCGAGPHHIRALAEAVGRTPPANRYSADMPKHAFFGTDPSLPKEYTDYAGRL